MMQYCAKFVLLIHTLQSSMKSGQDSRTVQINFNAPLIGSTIREFSISSVLWVLEDCVVHIETVSIKSITESYCVRLSE